MGRTGKKVTQKKGFDMDPLPLLTQWATMLKAIKPDIGKMALNLSQNKKLTSDETQARESTTP